MLISLRERPTVKNMTATAPISYFMLHTPVDSAFFHHETRTIRIISHKSDIKSRKELITCMRTGASREYECHVHDLSSVSRSIFEYEYGRRRTVITVIDCDYDAVDSALDSTDIIYVDASENVICAKHDPNRAKIEWLCQFIETDAALWYYSGINGLQVTIDREAVTNSSLNCKETINVTNSGLNCKETWLDFIEKKFGVKNAIQTVTQLFDKTTAEPTVLPGWPLPKMTITIPKHTNIESIKHNREAGTIEIIFG